MQMHLVHCLRASSSVLAFILLLSTNAWAQDPDPPAGMRLHDSYIGGNIDKISSSTGALVVNIPLLSYPQRGGKLMLDLALHYENRGAYATQTCILGRCTWTWFYRGSGFEIVDTQNMALGGTTGSDQSVP